MMTVAVALLKKKDKFFFQKRTQNSSQLNLIGCYGGQAEERETPRETILRELSEETTLNIEELALKFLGGINETVNRADGPQEVRFNVFEGEFEGDFNSLDGEKIMMAEADIKDNLDNFTPGTKAILRHYEII